MAVIRRNGPIGRFRGQRFGGSMAAGSKFGAGARVELNTIGLDKAEKVFIASNIADVLRPVGQQILDRAQELVPVRTGNLRDSGFVQTVVEGDKAEVNVGFSANYAAPVEFGGGGFRGPSTPQPYLRPAYDEVLGNGGPGIDQIQEGLSDLLNKLE